MCGGDAGEPGGAEKDEGHWTICYGSEDVRRYPTVYRRPHVRQAADVGVWSRPVLETSDTVRLLVRSLGRAGLPNTSGVFAQRPGQGILPGDQVSRRCLHLGPMKDIIQKSSVEAYVEACVRRRQQGVLLDFCSKVNRKG